MMPNVLHLSLSLTLLVLNSNDLSNKFTHFNAFNNEYFHLICIATPMCLINVNYLHFYHLNHNIHY